MTTVEKVAAVIRQRIEDADLAAELVVALVRQCIREELIDEMAYGSRLENERRTARERKRLQRERDKSVTCHKTERDIDRDQNVTVTEKSDSASPAPPPIRSVLSGPESDSLPGILSNPDQTRVERSDPVLMVMPCDGDTAIFEVTESLRAKHQAAYPSLNVLAEYSKALVWLDANPARKKTAKGATAFLVNWLSRAQNSGQGRDMSRGQSVTSRDRSVTPARNFTQEANDQVRLQYLQQVAAMEGK